MGSEVFLDTVYAVSLAADSDQLHGQAVLLSEQLERERVRLVTTQAILLEIGNAMSKLRFRKTGVDLLLALNNDPMVDVVPLTQELYREAFELFRQRSDKEWGLIDCLSFVVMRRRGIRDALTSDQHFEQAGFRIMLHRG